MCGICVSIYHNPEGSSCLFGQIDELLRNRGPDIEGKADRLVGIKDGCTDSSKIKFDFHGCVLHLRGTATKQPLQDSFGNILLWNGEIFGGNFQVSESQNDGEQLLDCLSVTALDQNQDDFEKRITKILQGIHGPWAFIYWQNKFKQLWFGRDFFGRRSLLWHFPSSKSDSFTLSSVATRSPEKIWHEVPASKIYRISAEDLSRFYIDQKNNIKLEDCIHSRSLSLPWSDFNIVKEQCCPGEKDYSLMKDLSKTSIGDESGFSDLIDDNYCGDSLNSSRMKAESTPNTEEHKSINSLVDSSSAEHYEKTRNMPSAALNTAFCFSDSGTDKRTNTTCRYGGLQIISELSKLCLEYKKTLLSESNCISIRKEETACGEAESFQTNKEINSELINEINPLTNCNCLQHVILPQLQPRPPNSENTINRILLDFYINKFLLIMEEATRRRVYNLPRHCAVTGDAAINVASNLMIKDSDSKNAKIPRVGILFSGGIDCMTLAALADRVLPEDEPIDLLNVAFAQQLGPVILPRRKKNSQNGKKKDPYDVPDRITGRSGVKELNSKRTWNFIEVDITLEEVKNARERRVKHLLHPLETVLDDSIGCAIWFAARGRGTKYQLIDQELEKISDDYCSPVKVLLTGMGADEQLGGYARHRSKFEKFGWCGLAAEIKMETERISSRNLGRDDRCISDHGREARFPFLDENVVSFLESVPIWIKCDPRLSRGHGEKRLLRQMATRLNLTGSVSLPKRAIQFGSRIAKLENSKEKGSDSCNRLASTQET